MIFISSSFALLLVEDHGSMFVKFHTILKLNEPLSPQLSAVAQFLSNAFAIIGCPDQLTERDGVYVERSSEVFDNFIVSIVCFKAFIERLFSFAFSINSSTSTSTYVGLISPLSSILVPTGSPMRNENVSSDWSIESSAFSTAGI